MSKSAAALTTTPSALDQARAELARRSQRFDAEFARFGAARDGDFSPRNRHLRKRWEAHRLLVRQAQMAVQRLERADTIAQLRAEVQAEIDATAAEIQAREAEVQRETAARDEAAGRVKAFEEQIAQLEGGRAAGLDVAQAALATCTAAGDQAGAAAAAEECARIEASAANVAARLRPLQLQRSAVADLVAAAEARIEAAENARAQAEERLRSRQTELLAIGYDEAAFVLRDAAVALELAARGKFSAGRFAIGASRRLLAALDMSAPIEVGNMAHQAEVNLLRPVDESIFAIDPATLATTLPEEPASRPGPAFAEPVVVPPARVPEAARA